MGRERALPGSLGRLSHRRTPVVAIGCLAVITLLIGLPLTYVYGGVPTFGYLAGIGGPPVVLIYLTVNIAVTARSAPSSRRVQARAASAHPGGRLRGIPVPPVGHPVPGCLHAGEPAALHIPRLAGHRGDRRRNPTGATARHLPGPGEGPSHRSRISSESQTRRPLRRSRGCRRRTGRTGPSRPWR